MAWQAVYDDLQVYSSETTDHRDLPVDGLQALTVDGKLHIGTLDCCGFAQVDGKEAVLVPRPTATHRDMRALYPDAVIVRSKTISTRQFHKVEVMTGLWSPMNPIPHEGWMKDVVGWRLWTETEVFDSVGVAEADWPAHWESLPGAGIQGLILYENWQYPKGYDCQQVVYGKDRYALAPSPYGPVFLNTNAPIAEIEQRHPGAAVKTGSRLPDDVFWPLHGRFTGTNTFR
jgi:hypothetical protein